VIRRGEHIMVSHTHHTRLLKLAAAVVITVFLGALPLDGSAKKQYRPPAAAWFSNKPTDKAILFTIWNVQNIIGMPASVSVSPPTATLGNDVTVTLQLSGITSDDRDVTYTSSADISNDLPRTQTVTAGYGTDHISFRVNRLPVGSDVYIYADDGQSAPVRVKLTINRPQRPTATVEPPIVQGIMMPSR
jgi:hypothetical protein